jgi:hypothetical protein
VRQELGVAVGRVISSPTRKGGVFLWIFIADPLDTMNVLGYTWNGRVKYGEKLLVHFIVPQIPLVVLRVTEEK